ncbi:hypothetical protein ACNKHO_21510 [Shigella flexneri]
MKNDVTHNKFKARSIMPLVIVAIGVCYCSDDPLQNERIYRSGSGGTCSRSDAGNAAGKVISSIKAGVGGTLAAWR